MKNNCNGCIFYKKTSVGMGCHFCIEKGRLRRRDGDSCLEKLTERKVKEKNKTYTKGHLTGQGKEIDEYIKNKTGSTVIYL